MRCYITIAQLSYPRMIDEHKTSLKQNQKTNKLKCGEQTRSPFSMIYPSACASSLMYLTLGHGHLSSNSLFHITT